MDPNATTVRIPTASREHAAASTNAASSYTNNTKIDPPTVSPEISRNTDPVSSYHGQAWLNLHRSRINTGWHPFRTRSPAPLREGGAPISSCKQAGLAITHLVWKQLPRHAILAEAGPTAPFWRRNSVCPLFQPTPSAWLDEVGCGALLRRSSEPRFLKAPQSEPGFAGIALPAIIGFHRWNFRRARHHIGRRGSASNQGAGSQSSNSVRWSHSGNRATSEPAG
jgi:hypothetical protein